MTSRGILNGGGAAKEAELTGAVSQLSVYSGQLVCWDGVVCLSFDSWVFPGNCWRMSVRADTDDKSLCGGCKAEMSARGKSVECDGCKCWWHDKCAEIKSELCSAKSNFSSKKGAGLYWFCVDCNAEFKKMREEIRALQGRVGVCEKLGTEIKKEMEDIKSELQIKGFDKKEVEAVRKEIEEVRKENIAVKKSFAEIVKEEMVANKPRVEEIGDKVSERKLRMEIAEMQERAKRRDKLVLFGVPEEGSDGEGADIVHDVIEGLMPGIGVEYKLVGRIGVKGVKARPIRIVVVDPGHRRKLLSKARDLRDMESLSKIYVVPDLTRKQQEEDRKLREEVRLARRPGVTVRIQGGIVITEENGVVGNTVGTSGIN